MIINGIEIGGGVSAGFNRFITTPKTLSAGSEEVLNDMFVISSYTISGYNATYSIADYVVYNNALLNILDTIWVDGTLSVEGIFTLGLPQNNTFDKLITII